MKHKQKIALLSVASIPAAITLAPTADVHAITKVADTPSNAHPHLPALVASTTSSDTATTFTELKNMVTEKLNKYESTFTIKYKGSTANLRTDLNTIFNDFDTDPANRFIKDATIARDYTYTGYVNNMTITFNIQSNTNYNTEENVKAEIKRIKNKIILQNMTDLQKIKAIHDYVVTNATFAKTTGSPAYALLTEKKGMSNAYALVTHYLLQEAGFTSQYVTGTYKDMPHAWTVVQFNGDWYHLDTALDEPSVYDTKITDMNAISYKYFLRGTNGMNTHTASLPSGVIIAADTPNNFKAIQNVYNPIQSEDTLYYTKEDDTIAKLDLTPLPRIDIDLNKKLEEFVFTTPDSAGVSLKAKYLVHHNGWLYFNNPDDRGYLYKVSTDNEDLTLVAKSYARDLKVIGSSLQYTKADNTTSTVPLIVNDFAIETVINLINKFGNTSTPNIKDVVNAKLAYEKLTASQKAFITNINTLNSYISGIVPNSIEDIIMKIALLDETELDFSTKLENIRLAYIAIPDTDKSKVYNYNDFTAAQNKQATQATQASAVNTQINLGLVSSNPTYYADVEKAKLAFDGLTPAQQSLISNANKTKLKNAVDDLHRDRLAVANIIYQISVLDITRSNFKEAFTLINTTMDSLTPNQKSLITNMPIFKTAETKLSEYSTEVNSLKLAIQAITTTTTTAQLQSLYNRFIIYNAAQREMLTSATIDELYNAIATDFAKSNTVDIVISKIGALKAENATFVLNVTDARIAFNAFNVPANIDSLTPEQKASFIAAEQRLEVAEGLVEDIKTLVQAISIIPTTVPTTVTTGDTFTVDYKAKVDAVIAGINTLKNKTQVGPNPIPADLLMKDHAEKHITNIALFHTAQKNITDGNNANTLLSSLSDTSPLADITAARTAYDALTNISKKFVTNAALAKLVAQETRTNQAAADEVTNLITALDPTDPNFLEKLTEARTEYDALTVVQKGLVSSDAKAKLEELEKASANLKKVYDAIEAISEDDAKNYIANYDAAQALYTKLDEDQKLLISNRDKLDTVKANIDAAKAVIAEIDALSKDSTEEAIVAVKAKYDDLEDFQKKLVTNYSKLESLIDKANGKEEAEAVIKMIDKLDETKKTFAVDVKRAREAYDALTPKQKEYVTNYEDLLKAEEIVAGLVDTSDIAKKMIAQIAAINNTSASFKTDVDATKNAYAALSEEQQALVNNYNVLKEHLATYDTYAATAKKLEDKINALSDSSSGYQAALAALQSEYNAFNAAQKAFVPEYAVKLLNAAQSGIDAVRNVTNMILALNQYKFTFHADVANARAAYNALIKNHGVYLSAYLEEALERAEALVEKDKTAARKVVNAINSLSSDSILKEIQRARRVYNNLTALQRPLVTNLQTLIDFETGKLSYNTSGIPSGEDTDDKNTNTEETNPLPDFAAVPGERTAMTKSVKSDTYTAQIYVSEEVGNSERFVLTTRANVTAIIPPTVTVVGDKTGTMAIEIQATSSRISFKATIDKKTVTFASEVDIILESVPRNSVILRVDQDGNRVPASYTIDGDQYTIKTKSSDTFIITRQNTMFSDIQNDSHKEYIEELAARNIIQNTNDGKFNPNQHITRSEFAVMMARALDIQPSTSTSFNDIKGKSYENEVQALYEVGIIQGVNSTTFNPNSTLTRQQAAMMVERMLDYVNVDTDIWESPQFIDAHLIADGAINAVALMQSLDIVSGKPNGSFDPLGKLTRSQLAKILYKALQTADLL